MDNKDPYTVWVVLFIGLMAWGIALMIGEEVDGIVGIVLALIAMGIFAALADWLNK